MAQTKNQRKQAIAKARKEHHKAMTAEKKRLDTYVLAETKVGLNELKKMFPDIRNDGQAVDKAVEIAIRELKIEAEKP